MATERKIWKCGSCGNSIAADREKCPYCGKTRGREDIVTLPAITIPNTPAPAVSSTASHATKVAPAASAQETYVMTPAIPTSDSYAANFLKQFAWGTFIVGTISAIVAAFSAPAFGWLWFLIILVSELFAGGLILCAAELFTHLQRISDSLQRMTITKQ